MADKAEYRLPRWAPRVRKTEIERFYRSTVDGTMDHDPVDEVGYGLYARCKSLLEVREIMVTGRPKCPVCGTVLPQFNYWSPDEMLHCPKCDWECPAKAYKKTISRKNLGPGGLEDEIRAFMRGFETARSYGEKLVLIDTLIHRFHWNSEQSRPLATSLIEGSMKSTMAFLDRLTYGDSVPEEVLRTREQWREAWAKNEWSHGRGQ